MPEKKEEGKKAKGSIPGWFRESENEFDMLVFSMDGCPPCRALSEAMEELEERYENVNFREVKRGNGFDVDIFMYPTVFFSDGDVMLKKIGAPSEVPANVKFYSRIIEAFKSGEVELYREEGKAILDGEIELNLEEIR